MKMSFISQDFDNLNIITVLEGRTQSIIRNHFLKYESSVKIITMDMFIPYYDLTRQLRFRISRLRLKQSPRLFHSRTLKLCRIAFTLRFYISKLRLKQSTGLFYSNILAVL